ncbi:MAG: hypothetical protein HUU55_23625 [Myxococcales bacterium]|nr:hypothetical protein [Myxococcales bacterium]
MGYHVHIAETCRNLRTEILTDFEVLPANENDYGKERRVLERLDKRGWRPTVLNVDAGYCTGQGIVDAQAQGTLL